MSDRRRAAVALGALLAGCGFELRRPPTLAFRTIAFSGFERRSPLEAELRRVLASTPVRVMPAPNQAEVVLHALLDAREKSVVASSAAGQVREFTLRLKFNFRATTPSGRELIPPVELLLTRDLNYSETLQLGKEQEEAELYREMQADAVQQVLRRLAAIRL